MSLNQQVLQPKRQTRLFVIAFQNDEYEHISALVLINRATSFVSAFKKHCHHKTYSEKLFLICHLYRSGLIRIRQLKLPVNVRERLWSWLKEVFDVNSV